MTIPKDSLMDYETKKYFRRYCIFNTIGTVLGFIICMFFIVRIMNKPAKDAIDISSAKELKKINQNIILAREKYDQELKKTAGESKEKDAAFKNELTQIHTELKIYKKQSNEKINAISNFQSDDIIREFSNIEIKFSNKR